MTNVKPSFLESNRQFIFFGGKGGVGKTTLAVASALYFAEQNPSKKILLVSTDPAHSIGDSLGQHIGDQTVPVQGIGNLFARETGAERLLDDFHCKNGSVLAKIVDRGTYFDKEDIRSFFELSLPGMDEFMAVLELSELVRTRQYDVIIVDTAPTGHTIRLLELPGLLQQWIGVLDLMMKKHRFMTATFSRGRYRPDDCDRWLETMAEDGKRVERLLQDATATEFVVVTIPEEMAVAESERLVAALKKFRISIRNLIVNHVVEQNVLCRFCQERRDKQAASMEMIERVFADLHVLKLPQLPCEVCGLDSLRRFARLVVGDLSSNAMGCAKPATAGMSEVQRCGSPLALPTASLVLIGGKGGVGKTSVAAATALELATRFPEKRVLLFSTDPAHSLSDSFSQRIGTEITPIETIPNLSAQEIDAPQRLVDFKQRYRKSINDVFNSFLGGSEMNVEFEQDVMERLLDLSPSGIDEVMALIEIMELMESRAFDVFVLDTAPTGHLLRFLEMPEIASDWLNAAMTVILKYQGLVGLGSVAGMVMKYYSQVRKLRKRLLDAAGTEIIVVTIPEAMSVVEMKRLLQALRKFEIACRQIVVNMITPPNDCAFCTMKRNEEQRYVREVIAQCSDHRVRCVSKLPHPVCGLTNLLEFKRMLWGDTIDAGQVVPGIDPTSTTPCILGDFPLSVNAQGSPAVVL